MTSKAILSIPDTGQLEHVPLPVVFRTHYLKRNSGILLLSRGRDERRIFFFSGEVRSARSNRMEQRIGQFALRTEAITRIQLMQAMSTGGDDTPFGQKLLNVGSVSEEQLDELLQSLVREIIFECFGWTAGDFQFSQGTPSIPEEVEISVSTADIIFHGFKQFANELMAMRVIDDFAAEVVPNPNPRLLFQQITLDDHERQILSLIDGTATTQKLLTALPGDSKENLIRLAALVACGLASLKTEDTVTPSVASFKDSHHLRRPAASPQPGGAGGAMRTSPGSHAGQSIPRQQRPIARPQKVFKKQEVKRVELSEKDVKLIRQTVLEKHKLIRADRDYYDLFGVPTRATQKEIRFAFMTLCETCHPDQALNAPFADLKPQMERVFETLEKAYGILGDHNKRKRYDRKIGWR